MPRAMSPETELRRLKADLRSANADRQSADRMVASLRVECTRLRAEVVEWKDRCDRMINALGSLKEPKA